MPENRRKSGRWVRRTCCHSVCKHFCREEQLRYQSKKWLWGVRWRLCLGEPSRCWLKEQRDIQGQRQLKEFITDKTTDLWKQRVRKILRGWRCCAEGELRLPQEIPTLAHIFEDTSMSLTLLLSQGFYSIDYFSFPSSTHYYFFPLLFFWNWPNLGKIIVGVQMSVFKHHRSDWKWSQPGSQSVGNLLLFYLWHFVFSNNKSW